MPFPLRWRPGYLAAAVAATALLILIHWLGLLRPLDDCLYDLSLRIRGPRPADARIVVVAVDEETLARFGPWPIRRSLYGELLKRLDEAEAVGFDILFAEPTEEDEAFGRQLRAHGRSVLAVYLERNRRVVGPVAPLKDSAVGHVHLEPDVDGILRRVYHHLRADQHPPLSSLAATLYRLVVPDAIRSPAFLGPDLQTSPGGFISQSGQMGINFYGGDDCVATVSLSDVVEGRFPPDAFRGKIVLVGVTAEGIETQLFTPFNQDRRATPGVCVHAQILANLLDGSAVKTLSPLALYPAALFFMLAGSLVLRRLSVVRAAVVWVGAVWGVAAVAGLGLAAAAFWVPPAILMGVGTCAFVLGYIARLLDAGQRLAAAKRDWQDVFDTIDDAITIHGPDGRLVRINRAAAEGFGPWLASLLSERCAKILGELKETAPTDADRHPYLEQVYLRGEDRHLEIKTLLRTDAAGRFAGLVQVVRDISDQLRRQLEQEELHNHSIQSQKMEVLGVLSGGIAHDFNNLISGMTGFAYLAAMDLPAEHPAASNIAEIQKVCGQAKELVDQILNFSRQRKAIPRRIQPSAMVGEMLRLMRVALPKNIVLRTDLRSRAMVMAEPTQIHQILINLCTNAGHAMRPKGGTLSIEVMDVDLPAGSRAAQTESLPPGPYVRMGVSDTGKGMTAEIVAKIFDPFFTTKPEGEGTGMGLAVVQKILKSIGGAITVESDPDQGTRFDVFLPAAGKTPQESPALAPKRLSILVADDDAAASELLTGILKDGGNAVTAVRSAGDALEQIRVGADRFDLVISDLNLPDFSGTRLAEEVGWIAPRLPVVLCTGPGSERPESLTVAASVRGWLVKPFSSHEVAALLKKVL